MSLPQSAYVHRVQLVDSEGTQTEGVNKTAVYVWDTASLSWVRATSVGGGGGGGGGLVTQGTTPWVTQGQDAAIRFEQASSTVAYSGSAPPGASETSAVWKISRVVTDSSGNVTVTWAGGVSTYSYSWSSRASQSYS